MALISYNNLIIEYGISEKTLESATSRYRKGLSDKWQNIKDAKDKRKVLINLDTITE